jgi:pimeloyl-ACP methyl ester carboxylesterase
MPNDLLLLHGALGAADQFAPLVAALGGSRRVHTLDFHGHGGAPDGGRAYRIEEFAADVIAFLDREGLASVDVFGYSMGGYVALHLASKGETRIGRVTTLGTKFRWDTATAERESARLDPATIRAKVPRFAEALEHRHRGAGGWEGVLAGTAECLRALGRQPLLIDETLRAITQPVRVMVGDRDATVSVEETAAVARVLSAGELAVLPRTPHPIDALSAEAISLVARLIAF